MTLRSSLIKNIYKKLKDFNKIDILNKKHNLKFLQELLGLVEILNLPLNKDKKKLKVKKYLFLCKVLLKGLNGTGMNYLVAYKK